ncbi:coiled-coil domain-containing protein 112-like [Lutzomyia longipalpis]|uniref:coiled-coil domain-containing protein 112-like n=1 Tax=Lutzomyia longipalpis TaxID=7200 RepID=UPI002483832B|nr:coiled-coil domain-containing protein 112-like [Lutzomyia longipalpis]
MAEVKITKRSPIACTCLLSKLKCQENYLINVQPNLEVFLEDEESTSEEKKLLAEIDFLQKRSMMDLISVEKTAQKIVNSMRESIAELKGLDIKIQNYNLKEYRERILRIEENIVKMQNTNKLNIGKLKFENIDIIEAIPLFVDLIKDEYRTYNIVPHRVSQMHFRTLKPVDEYLYKDVKAFDQFLKDFGGHTGGWEDEQHVIFIKYKTKYHKNIQKITEILLELIPGITTDDIKNHNKWFEEYMKLKENRKKKLEEWRKSK